MKKMLYLMSLVIMLCAFLPVHTYAGTKKMTVYKDVLKDGKELYAAGGGGLYRVNLKNMKVKKLVTITSDVVLHSMAKKGDFLYFKETSGIVMTLYRVNLKTNKVKKIVDLESEDCPVGVYAYAVSGKKLYFNGFDEDSGKKYGNYVANLNGKHAKLTKTKIIMKEKTSNTKKYKIIRKENYDTGIYYDYLRTPKKTYYLGASK